MTERSGTVGGDITSREAEVLALVRERFTNAEIAATLYVSVRTIESHVSALLRKLNVTDRRQLAALRIDDNGDRGPPPEPVDYIMAPSALPMPLTELIGRADELAALLDAIDTHRLVTATGPGGVGKTRLALAAAHTLAADQPVAFVDLVRVAAPELITNAIADTLGIPERSGTDRDNALFAALAASAMVLVLDNCEHLVDAVRTTCERMLQTCPGVRVIATSRIRLMAPFEHVVSVPGLSTTDDITATGDAETLFLARMKSAGADAVNGPEDRDAVKAICRSLDGIALAIELAAARTPSIGIDGLHQALGAQLPLLTNGRRSDHRHDSVRAAIDWTYALLDDAERRALRAASVFAAPFDLAALAAVLDQPHPATLDPLARLVDWNLVAVTRSTTTEYRVLETIREYALLRAAEAEELTDWRNRHVAWTRTQVEQLHATLLGDSDWCASVDRVVPEAHAALAWLATVDGDAAAAFATTFAAVAFHRGQPGEAQRLYTRAADLTADPVARRHSLRYAAGAAASRNVGTDAIALLSTAADTAVAAGRLDDAAEDLAETAMLQLRASGIMAEAVDVDEVDATLVRAKAIGSTSHHAQAVIAVAEGWAPCAGFRSRAHTEAALSRARAVADPVLENVALDQLCVVALAEGDLSAAVEAVEQRTAFISSMRVDAANGFEASDAFQMACHIDVAAGRLHSARANADAMAALPFLREQRHLSLGRRMEVNTIAGEFDAVIRDSELFERDWRRAGRPIASSLAVGAYAAATTYGILGDDDAHRHWTAITEALLPDAADVHDYARTWMVAFDAMLALHRFDIDRALALLAVDPSDTMAWENPNTNLRLSWYAAAFGEAAALARVANLDDRLSRSRTAARGNPLALVVLDRAAALNRRDFTRFDEFAAYFDAHGCPFQARRTHAVRAYIAVN